MQRPCTCFIAIICFSIFSYVPSFANHLPGNYLTVRYSGAGNIYIVKLTYYRDCQALPAVTQTSVSYNIIGSAASSINLPLISSSTVPLLSCTPPGFSTCANGTGVEENIYETNVALTQPGIYRFYNEACCRGITSTYNNSAPVYVEAILDLLAAPGNSLPDFTSPAQFYFCQNKPANYQSLAADNDGDSLVYSLTPALDNTMGTPVGIQYSIPFSFFQFIPSSTPIAFNTSTGTVSFTPNQFASGTIVFKVEEYRNGTFSGSIMRETNLIITNGTSGINESSDYLMKLFPNPVTNSIHFSSVKNFDNWVISDITGRVLKTGYKIKNDIDYSVSVNELRSGIYFMHLFESNNKIIKKFIKE